MSIENIKHEIFSAISLCSYPPNITDSLLELIIKIMTYAHVKSSPNYKIKTISQEKIIAVRCPLEVPFNKRNYEVPIVIFFSKMFPIEPPKILLEVSKGSAINPKTKDVDIKTRKIITPSLRAWNQSSNIINIINEIRNSFSIIFPIYKMKKNQINDKMDLNSNNLNKRNDNYDSMKASNTSNMSNMSNMSNTININNNAIFNFVNNSNMTNEKMNTNPSISSNNDPFANIASIFTENFINNQNNNGFNFTFNNNVIQNMNNNFTNLKNQNNNMMNNNNINVININNINNMNNMNNFDINQMYEKENKIKNILIEAVFDKISTKLIGEYKKLNQQNKNLNNYKNQFKTENDRMEKYILKKQEITNECTKNLYILNNKIQKYHEYIKKEKNKKITENNCLQFINIDNPKLLRAISKEIMYEDLLIMIKKGFEKKKISFDEAISSTRDAARNLFISKIIIQKGLK